METRLKQEMGRKRKMKENSEGEIRALTIRGQVRTRLK